MFRFDVPPVVPRDYPVPQSFHARRKAFFAGGPRVAYVYEHPDSSTFRYRVGNMIDVLSLHPTASAAYFTASELDSLGSIVAAADALVICRCRLSDALSHLILVAKERGVRVFFDVDDLVFDVRYAPLLMTTLDFDKSEAKSWDHWFAYMGRLGATLRLCDAAITTNRFLADRITEFAGIPAHVLPNFMNREQLEISSRIYAQKQQSGFRRDDSIHFGYFSGSPTHNRDFGTVARALADLLERDPRVRIMGVGYIDRHPALQAFRDRIELHPMQDFVNLQRLIGAVEFNLVPLVDNVFTNCKSELKYFEAGIVGTVSIACPTHVFARSIEDGRNGFLARSLDWQAKLDEAIAALDRYPELAAAAHADCLARYSWEGFAGPVADVLFG